MLKRIGDFGMTKICQNCNKKRSTHKGSSLYCDVEGLKLGVGNTGWQNTRGIDNITWHGQEMIKSGELKDEKFFKFKEKPHE